MTMGAHSTEGGREALRTGGMQAGTRGCQESLTKHRAGLGPSKALPVQASWLMESAWPPGQVLVV